MKTTNWIAAFPGLQTLSPELLKSLTDTAEVVSLPAGTQIFGAGKVPEAYLLLLDGVVRVQQISDSGREIVLYRVSAGESCALTTACLMGYEEYARAVAIPRRTFDDLIARSEAFRRFVFTAFSVRITNLLRVIEDVAFSRIEIRLAQRLLELGGARGHVDLTHQQLAAELGTAREVISRQLNEFQRRGAISTSRGAIDIVDADQLKRLVSLP
jgi:CRP/FNR family transcriptional regulator, anaerobic regulatory protein